MVEADRSHALHSRVCPPSILTQHNEPLGLGNQRNPKFHEHVFAQVYAMNIVIRRQDALNDRLR